MRTLVKNSKVEAICAIMAGSKHEFLDLNQLTVRLVALGFRNTSKGGTRTIASRDLKHRGWGRKKKSDSRSVAYGLTTKFYVDTQQYAYRFGEMIPKNVERLEDRYAAAVGNGDARVPEVAETPKKKPVRFGGGYQPPSLILNGVAVSAATVLKVVAASLHKFNKRKVETACLLLVPKIKRSSIMTSWQNMNKHRYLVEDDFTSSKLTTEFYQKHLSKLDSYTEMLPDKAEELRANFRKYSIEQEPEEIKPESISWGGKTVSIGTALRAALVASPYWFTKGDTFSNFFHKSWRADLETVWKELQMSGFISKPDGRRYFLTPSFYAHNLDEIVQYKQLLPEKAEYIDKQIEEAQGKLSDPNWQDNLDSIDYYLNVYPPDEAERVALVPRSLLDGDAAAPERTKEARSDVHAGGDIDAMIALAERAGLVSEPRLDPRNFIGECVVGYLQSLPGGTNGNGAQLSAAPETNQGEATADPGDPGIPEEETERYKLTQALTTVANLQNRMKSIEYAKEKAETLAREASEAKFTANQEARQLKHELQMIKQAKSVRTAGTFKLGDVVTVKNQQSEGT